MLANGALVRLLRKLPSRSHAVYLARTADTENLVVVKTGGSPGSLSREASVLRWLAGSGVSVPVPAELLTDHRGGLVLVLRFVSGNHPLSATDFAEAGRTLATLHAVSLSPGLRPLPGPVCLGIDQVVRLGEALARPVALDLGELKRRLRVMAAAGVSFVHGDASTSNVLITPDGLGVLLDLENARVGYPGLDVGRFMFLAAQAPAVTEHMLAEFLAGYGQLPFPAGELSNWIAVAGLEIAIWRARNPGCGLSSSDAITRVADCLKRPRAAP